MLCSLLDLGGDLADERDLQLEFLREPDERDHDLGLDLDAFLLHLDGRLEDRRGPASRRSPG